MLAVAAGAGTEPVEDVEGVQLAEAHPGGAFPGEADGGHLCGAEHPVVVLEESTEVPVSFGEPSEHWEEPAIQVPPSTTSTERTCRPVDPEANAVPDGTVAAVGAPDCATVPVG